MASAINGLKATQLKNIATQCGLASSGIKSDLIGRLSNVLNLSTPATAAESRILSVDMGIRNLAYCVLSVPPPASKPCVPSVHAWKRMSLPRNGPEHAAVEQASTAAVAPTKELFDPSIYASHAYSLLKHSLLPLNPTHVLIERQRWRSMGGSAVLEWTLRVNMLESMLYAVLRTLEMEGIAKYPTIGVSPARVAGFWLEGQASGEGGMEKAERARRKAKKVGTKGGGGKTAKIDIVGNWLRSGAEVEMGTLEAENTRTSFLEKWEGKAKRVRKSKIESSSEIGIESGGQLKKIDDLADCLLQAMAWVRWEENKAKLRREGPSAFYR